MFVAFASLRNAFARFGRARAGATAVEFGLIALPFFFLTFGLAEVAMLGFAQTSLNFAVDEAGRRIRTGQAQLEGVSYSGIQNEICTRLNRFMSLSCENTLYLDVDRFDSFLDAAAIDSPIDAGVFNNAGFGYAPGDPSEIVVVRAYYRWSIMTPMFENIFGNVSGGERILSSTMMFRNEPYE